MYQLNASIVLFHTDERVVLRAIESYLKAKLSGILYLIDNSKTDDLKKLQKLDSKIKYIFTGRNLGYGKAHNIALRESLKENVKYHLVLNPDVYFEEGILEELYEFMEKHPGAGLVMPKVLNPDGSIQYLCKLLPTPFDLIMRRFLRKGGLKKFIEKRMEIYELRFTGYSQIMEVPFLSGCFMFLRVDALKKVGLFDERFFLYCDDLDLSRRINRFYKTVFYPYCSIYHEWGRGSYKKFGLLIYHIIDAIKYFNKWGWFGDKERNIINEKVLENLGYTK